MIQGGDVLTKATADPHALKLQDLVERVLSGQGMLDPDVRRAIAEDTEVVEPLAGYVDKVARHAHQITDSDVEELGRAGYSEDQVLEATISAALGAGVRRLQTGLDALRAARP